MRYTTYEPNATIISFGDEGTFFFFSFRIPISYVLVEFLAPTQRACRSAMSACFSFVMSVWFSLCLLGNEGMVLSFNEGMVLSFNVGMVMSLSVPWFSVPSFFSNLFSVRGVALKRGLASQCYSAVNVHAK